MSSLIYKNELFSVREFIVLAAYAGMDEIRMLSDTCRVQLKPEELNEIVFQLYQRGVLCWNGSNGYELDLDIRFMLQEIKYAKRELEIHFERGKGLLYCFVNTAVTVMELSQNDVEKIRVHRVSKEAFLEELSDRGIIPTDVSAKASVGKRKEWKKVSAEFLQKNPEIFRTGTIWHEKQREMLKKVLAKENELGAYGIVYDRVSRREILTILLLQKELDECIVTADAERIRTMKFEWEALKKIWKQQEGKKVVKI